MAQIHKTPFPQDVPRDVAEEMKGRAQTLYRGVRKLSLAPSPERIIRSALNDIGVAIIHLESADPETDKAKAACEKLLPALREAKQRLRNKPDSTEAEKAMKMAEDALRELNEAEKNEPKTPS